MNAIPIAIGTLAFHCKNVQAFSRCLQSPVNFTLDPAKRYIPVSQEFQSLREETGTNPGEKETVSFQKEGISIQTAPFSVEIVMFQHGIDPVSTGLL